MNDSEKKEIWSLIIDQGELLKGKLREDCRHPKGRNPYAHICSLIISEFGCSYKEINSENIGDLKEFIVKIYE